ncbi:MAG TPA: tetratricopeptide repeat protein [Chroococcidiopsis sp.]
MKMHSWHVGTLGAWATAVTVLSGSLGIGLPIAPAIAGTEPILQQEGVLRPAYGEHRFQGTAGQAVTITMTSTDFDTVLTLVGPNGEQVSYNDDDGMSLNSRIVALLPATGTYVVQAGSFGGTISGDYTVAVRTATPYELTYAQGLDLFYSGDIAGAIEAYDKAIRIDPNLPDAYLRRADALYALAQQLQPAEREAILVNYRRVLEIYEQTGNEAGAQQMRDQIMSLESQ